MSKKKAGIFYYLKDFPDFFYRDAIFLLLKLNFIMKFLIFILIITLHILAIYFKKKL